MISGNQCMSSQISVGDLSPIVLTDGRAIVLNLSTGSRIRGERIDAVGVARLTALIEQAMAEAGTKFAFGRYAEPRELYNNDLFASEESDEHRTIHLGIDLFCAADTPVAAPLDGVVEIVAENARDLDYGPMLIIRHTSRAGAPFYSLLGHLSVATLDCIKAGQRIRAGQRVGWVGCAPGNGNWPPHLHFQIILDLLKLGANFPGVAFNSQREYWMSLSPSPALFFPEHEPTDLEF